MPPSPAPARQAMFTAKSPSDGTDDTVRRHTPMVTTRLASEPDRWIRLEGPLNFRDLGGYAATRGTVRRGLLYRSDGLDSLSVADLGRVRDELGIRRIIDLRSSTELDGIGLGAVLDSGIDHHHVPIIDQTRSMIGESTLRIGDLYRTMLVEGGPRFVAGIELVADSDGPTVFHCMAGKDRTGLLAALLLSLLGVTDDDVCRDYALSATIVPELRQRFMARMQDPGAARPPAFARLQEQPDAIEEMMSARPATIRLVLDELRDRHGGVDRWLRDQGLGDDHVERLHATLVA